MVNVKIECRRRYKEIRNFILLKASIVDQLALRPVNGLSAPCLSGIDAIISPSLLNPVQLAVLFQADSNFVVGQIYPLAFDFFVDQTVVVN